ncbi:response regulator [Pseudomonas sp. SZ57]|uniref:PAS domain-containing hybrid sensor histidine kinase/response regulator n=1 Tax=Pseudomonas sp. SZ57 TaxID=2662259 RepID=UPI0012919FC0|nr:PAS domain-containing hybrid sensor histidine kinase/response regulator [Pseudomonas sp. SZ57]MQQ34692.1 response regulator [Pseudomonas sp. SZ57]
MDALPTQLLQLALQSADLGVWMLDLELDQEVLRSLRHDQIFGYETLQPHWGLEIALTHILEADRHILTDAFERARTVGSLSCEFRVRWPDGSIHWVSPLGRTEFSEDGTPLRVSGVVADITVRKQMEAESLQRNKMAAIGELTAGIAHDFNNILQGLGVSFELIANLAISGRFSAVPERAKRGQQLVQRAAMITHRLLAFSRRSPLTPCALDLASRLPDIISLLRPTANHQVNVTVRVSPNLPAIHVDSAQFEAAILNLLVNARDASPRGGNIEVTAQHAQDMSLALDDDKTYQRYAVIEVTDQGGGIPPEQLDQVFEPFFTTKPIGSGTGLGLSQVYGFANQSGGKVDLDSVLRVGTRVRMWLPLETSDSSTNAVVETPSSSHEQSLVIDKPTRRILLVDDEFEVRETLATRLQQLGHEVTVTSDASGALEHLREAVKPFDLMISDIGLTGPTDGCELAYQCRGLYGDLPVLLITGYAGDDLEKRLPPDTLVLVKPFDMPTLVATMAKCVT